MVRLAGLDKSCSRGSVGFSKVNQPDAKVCARTCVRVYVCVHERADLSHTAKGFTGADNCNVAM